MSVKCHLQKLQLHDVLQQCPEEYQLQVQGKPFQQRLSERVHLKMICTSFHSAEQSTRMLACLCGLAYTWIYTLWGSLASLRRLCLPAGMLREVVDLQLGREAWHSRIWVIGGGLRPRAGHPGL